MERRSIHLNGPILSRLICGAWRWDSVSPATVDELIRTSLDEGITSFDNADIYGDHSNEEIFGNALRKDPALRKEMQLITKCGIKFPSAKRPSTWVKHYDTSKKHIIWSAENSLRNFGTDYIDVLLIHRPDPLLDPHEVAEAFQALHESGKVLYFGVSNFTAFQFEMLQSYVSTPLVTNQIELSLTCSQALFDGTIDVLMKHRTSAMAWSPLGGGAILSEKNRHLFSQAPKYNATESQLSLAWLLKHPGKVFPVIGTTKAERIRESVRACELQIDVQDWFAMLQTALGKEMP